MTFFLNAPSEPPIIPANNPNVDLPDWSDGYRANVSAAQLRYNSNFVTQRRAQEVRSEIALDAARRIGGEVLADRMKASGMPDEKADTFAMMANRGFDKLAPDMQQFVLEEARKEAEANPEAWSDFDMSEETIEKRTNERLQTEYQDAQDVIGMMRDGQALASFLGEMTALVGDVKTLPLFLVGAGSGSFARVVGTEALIGGASEAALLPTQFAMAERLEIEDPDPIAQIAFGTAAGGILGGTLNAAARGYYYFKGRSQTEPIGRMDEFESEVMVDRVEDILTSSTVDHVGQIQKLVDELGVKAQEPPYRLENPINPERPPLIPEPITTQRLDPVTPDSEPLSDANLIETAQAGIDSADPVVKGPKPKGRRPTSLKTFVVKEGGIWKGDDAGEIAAMEYRRVGFEKVNKLETSTAGDNGGGRTIDDMRSRAVEAGFLPEGATINDFLDALDADIRGTARTYSQDEALAALDWDAFDGIQRDAGRDAGGPQDFAEAMAEYEAMRPSSTFVDREAMDFSDDPEGDIRKIFDTWAQDSGWGNFLTPNEAEEILSTLQKRGGDPGLLAEMIVARELDYAELPSQPGRNAPFDPNDPRSEIPGEGSGTVGEPRPGAREEGGSGTGVENGGSSGRAVEQTAAGDQTLIDGVAPVTQRDRLQAAQNAPLRGGNAAADDGLFDVSGRGQADMFSDPASPEAQQMHEITANNMRAEIEADGDFDLEVEMPGGGSRVMSASEMLDYLDEGDAFSARIDLCGKGPS